MSNDFLPFATEPGADVMDQAAYLAAAFRGSGFENGIAIAERLNKVWRQASAMSAALGEYVANTTGDDVLDDGDIDALALQIAAAIEASGIARPARIVTASAGFTILSADYAIGLNRTAGVAAQAIALPSDAIIGQSFVIEDLVGNLNAYPVTVSPPGGQTLAGLATFVMNEDRQSAEFRYYASNLWSIRS